MSSAFFAGVAAAVAVAAVEGKTNKPNILFILADDLGWVTACMLIESTGCIEYIASCMNHTCG